MERDYRVVDFLFTMLPNYGGCIVYPIGPWERGGGVLFPGPHYIYIYIYLFMDLL